MLAGCSDKQNGGRALGSGPRSLIKKGITLDDENDDTTDVEETDTPDVSAYVAKIEELTGVIAERDTAISTLTADLTASKAANYDLLMSIPKNDSSQDTDVDVTDVDPDVDIDDLFD